jgi:cytochrome c oxidase cbb3-type subunit III
MSVHEVDAATGTSTTGHEWDGIKELNTPLPRWWVWVFYATILWSIGYWVVYPALPLISSFTAGVFGYSSRGEVAADVRGLQAARSGMVGKLEAAPLAAIKSDPTLFAFATAQGRTAFGNNCAPCHGIGGGGAKGYPNLNDNDWLWGGSLDQIYQTIAYGIRSGHAKGRESTMIGFGKDGVLKRNEIVTVARYVRSLSGLPVPAGTDLAAGQKLFADNCAACHGDAARGNPEIGAPNLADRIWLYGPDEASIVEVITNGKNGVMPAWVDKLDPATLKALAVYVHSLGGGQ